MSFLGSRDVFDVAAVKEADVTDFLARLREGDPEHLALSASSAARTVVAVRGFHAFTVREKLAPRSPAAGVKPPQAPKRLPKALPLSDIEAILEASSSGGSAPSIRDRALLELLYGVGARISEAVGLDLDDLDLAESMVRLSGKGGKARLVPVGSFAKQACERYLVQVRPQLIAPGRATSAIFLNLRGSRLSRQSAWAVLSKAAGRAGITTAVSPHTLRHSFATHLLDGGADVRVVQELLGHASVTTTQIYTLVTVDKLREVYATAHPRSLQ